MSRRAALALGLGLLALPGAALAQDDFDDVSCRNGLFSTYPPFALAEVVGDERAYFHEDMDGCPEGAGCRQTRYVVPGDVVVVSRLRTDHACAYFLGVENDAAGYLPLSQLKLLPTDAEPPEGEWIGEWMFFGNPGVSVELREGRLHVSGLAFWPGNPDEAEYPSVNIGEIDGPLTLFGNRARYQDGYCAVDFILLGDWLLADDNMRCGGLNVTFSAVYKRMEQPD